MKRTGRQKDIVTPEKKQEQRELLRLFSANIRKILKNTDLLADDLQEIRLRTGAPLLVVAKDQEYFLTPDGALTGEWEKGYPVSPTDIRDTMDYIGSFSLYAYEDELRQGFLTVQGGHRIGVAGRTILENGHIKAIHPITFLNVRFSHQMIGCAAKIRSILTDPGTGSIRNTLLIAPPRCGKTTLLRDLIRMVSDGEEGKDRGSALRGSFERPKAGAGHENKAGKMVEMRKQHGGKVRAQTVGVVDERSEIAACYQGIPQNDVGCRTDVLDACPKAEGMMMLIRSMAPEGGAGGGGGGAENPDSIVIGVKIDGTQDIMSAVAVPSDEELALLSSYPDRYYSSYSAHRGVNPNLLFRHLLTRLNFQIIGGNEASCVKAGEAAGQETCVRVTKIEVLSKSAGSLTIAKAGGDRTSAGSLQFDSEVDTLVLMQRPEGTSDNVDLEPMDVVMPTWNSISNSGNEVQAGDAMLVAPDRSYEVKITLRQRVQTGVDGSDRPVMEDKELIVKDVISLSSSSSAAGFLAGNSYNVKIVVYGLEKVNVNATLTPWTEGEDIYLDPIDGAASLAAQGE